MDDLLGANVVSLPTNEDRWAMLGGEDRQLLVTYDRPVGVGAAKVDMKTSFIVGDDGGIPFCFSATGQADQLFETQLSVFEVPRLMSQITEEMDLVSNRRHDVYYAPLYLGWKEFLRVVAALNILGTSCLPDANPTNVPRGEVVLRKWVAGDNTFVVKGNGIMIASGTLHHPQAGPLSLGDPHLVQAITFPTL
ncbi:MAG: hypothetical protein WC773_00260 [Patescibacteria group bacterium]|jgi:hypothetical protein